MDGFTGITLTLHRELHGMNFDNFLKSYFGMDKVLKCLVKLW
jgi:hypothetical protein